MNRTQWITVGIAVFLVFGLYAATQDQFFGAPKKGKAASVNSRAEQTVSIDSIIFLEKQGLTEAQVTRLNQLENSISRGDVTSQKIHIYHQLAKFWADTAREFVPYAWYTGEAARLENSEKSLTFAARSFLAALREENDFSMRKWEALQAKDLFERSLKINPANDSVKVFLGEVYVYGGIAMPMEGVSMIKEVAEKDPRNLHAQFSLVAASLASGQMDKAIERLKGIVAIDPANLIAILQLAEVYEKTGDKPAAVVWYEKSLPYAEQINGLKEEVLNRINLLKK